MASERVPGGLGRRTAMAPCAACGSEPVMRCGRCTATRCEVHALGRGARCGLCELDWAEDAPTRRAAKILLAPPAAVLAGGALLGALWPIALGSALGSAIIAALAGAASALVGTGACRLVDRSARAAFLRERAGALPTARLLPSPRRL